MNQNLRMLDQVQVAKPCPANWDEMKGNDQVRHCTHCRLNVYNLSEMSTEAAERLIQNTEGRMCIRMYRRNDGTMITRDCPKGVRAAREKMARVIVMAASCVLSAIGCGSTADRLKADFGLAPTPPAPTIMGKMSVLAVSAGPPVPPTGPKSVVKAPLQAQPGIEMGEVAYVPKTKK